MTKALALTFLTAVLAAAACGPMSHNEGDFVRPTTFPGKAKYKSPNGISDEELERVTPGTTSGPRELEIAGETIVFPVRGSVTHKDDFGAPRKGHSHRGNDIFAPKMTPVVAMADGYVLWMYGQSSGKCCYLALGHADGWQSYYVHLNNDSDPSKDDGKGNGIAPHLRVGTFVRAGEVIGWVGDSGNAEDSRPHLHFEIHYYERPINPYKALIRARTPREYRQAREPAHERDIEPPVD